MGLFFRQFGVPTGLATHRKIGAMLRPLARSGSVIIKFSRRATQSILALAVLTSLAMICVAGLALRPLRAAIDAVIDMAIVRELTGVSDAIKKMPAALRQRVLARREVRPEHALDESLNSQWVVLAVAARLRAKGFAANDRRSSCLIALAPF